MKWWAISLLGATPALALPALDLAKRNSTGIYAFAAAKAVNSTAPYSLSNSTGYNDTLNGAVNQQTSAVAVTSTSTVTAQLVPTPVTVTQETYEFPHSRLGAVPTLLPALAETHDTSDLSHLTPQQPGSGAVLHYVQEATPGSYDATVYAVVTPNFKNSSVVLDHSEYLTVTAPSDCTLKIAFSDSDAYAHSKSNWATDDNLLFVTYTAGCGGHSSGERCYFSATEVIFDDGDKLVLVFGNALDLQDAINNVNVVWGSYGQSGINMGSAGTATSASGSEPTTYWGGGGDDDTPAASSAASAASSAYSAVPTTYTGGGGDDSSCVAPVDTVYGLPTACLGTTFDRDLDQGLGYKNSSGFSFDDFLDDITLDSDNNDDDSYSADDADDESYDFILSDDFVGDGNTLSSEGDTDADSGSSAFGDTSDITKRAARRRHLARRGLYKRGLVDKIKAKAKSFAEGAKKLGVSLVDGAKAIGTLAYNIATGKPNTFDTGVSRLLLPRNSTDCNASKSNCKPIDSKTKVVTSPWGDAILLKSVGSEPSEKKTDISATKSATVTSGKFVNLYCVKCGLSGGSKIAGNITIDGLNGITAGYASANFDMTVGVGLGIDAQAVYSKTIKNNLYDVPLSPFTLGFITVGPILSLGTELTFVANATGRVLARAEFSIARAEWKYDFVKGTATQIGFKPEFRPSVEAEGQISVSAAFGLPVGLELAITTFNGCTRCKGSVGIVDTPSLKAEATIAFEANVTKSEQSAGIKAVNNCTGISTTISFGNKVAAVAKGFGIAEKEWKIHDTGDIPIKSWCIGKKTDGKTKRAIPHIDAPRDLRANFPHLYVRQSSNATNATVASNTTDDTLIDLSEYVVSSNTSDVGYAGPSIDAVPYDLSADYLDGYDFTTITLQNASNYILAACSDDNVYIQLNTTSDSEFGTFTQCNSLWQRFDDIVLSTPNGGILHYYNNTMSKVGVSRLRTGDQEKLPDTSVYVALVPLDGGSEDDSDADDYSNLVAIDTEYNVFYPAVCSFKNSTQGSKIFIIEDQVKGLEMLKSTDIEYSITGGEVDDCWLLPLVEGSDVQGEWADEGTAKDLDGDGNGDDDAYYLNLSVSDSDFDENGAYIGNSTAA